MIWFKSCPRCMTGDLVLSEDMYGKYQQCFQCGHVVYPRQETVIPQERGKATKKQRIAA
jgi:hypothetical protein